MYALPYVAFLRLHRYALDARRRDRTWRYLAWSVLAGVTGGLLVGVTLAVAELLWMIGWWPLAIGLVALFAVPLLDPLLARHVLVPLGAVRPAYWIARLGTMRDPEAYALCVAAWAHSHRPTPSGEAWIAARRDRRVPLGDAEIVTTALVTAGRGDAESARQLMRSTAFIVEDHPAVRELAGEWLACDAAERGAWQELADDGRAATWPASSLTYLLEGIASRRTGAGTPSVVELHARWLIAPFRRATRPLLDAALAVTPAPAAATTVSEPEPIATADDDARGAAPLPRAIAAQLAFATDVPTPAALARAVAAWDAALADPATRTWLARRALELDAPLGAADRALRDIAASVTDELGRAADRAGLSLTRARGIVGDGLAHRLRHGRLDALEAGFTSWADRRHSGAIRAPIDEWREWVALRASYDATAAAGGLDVRRLAFPHVYRTATTMAAWLWNSRHEYAVSHAISAWLRVEAMAVGDAEAIELCTRNCSLAVPTRLGSVSTP